MRIPHEWEPPALTCTNVPVGSVAWPYWFEPKHASVPPVCTPQAW